MEIDCKCFLQIRSVQITQIGRTHFVQFFANFFLTNCEALWYNSLGSDASPR